MTGIPVELDGVAVRAGKVRILEHVDLTVGSGEAIGVFGGNGAGKTTLLRCIATLTPPAAGSGSVLGVALDSAERYTIRPRIGYVGHIPGLYPRLSLAENLRFEAAIRGLDASAADDALGAVGLAGAADRITERCSHGMQRRAEFARVVMTEPDLLLLDEPHTALDRDAVDLVAAIVRRTTDRGGAAVIVSHDRERVAQVASRFVEIRSGTSR